MSQVDELLPQCGQNNAAEGDRKRAKTNITQQPQQQQKLTTRPITTRADAQKACALIAVTFCRDEPHSILSGSTPIEEYQYYEGLIDGVLSNVQATGYSTAVICVDENDDCVGTIFGCPAVLYNPGPKSAALAKGAGCLEMIDALGEEHLSVKDLNKRVIIAGAAAAPHVRSRTGGSCAKEMFWLLLQQCRLGGFHCIVAECSSAKSVHQLTSTAPLTFVRAKMSYRDYHQGGPMGKEKRFGFLTPRQEKYLNFEMSLVEIVLPGAPGYAPHLAHIPSIKLGDNMALLRQQFARERGIVVTNTRATTTTTTTTAAMSSTCSSGTVAVDLSFPKAKI